ncbi:2642_t:CDS:1 [Funneliformis caledonium]|uniref:2642_t:CDS:1 n=1 Tax=Funneliformis caledonium TaxID=1117310 RepID=A0A9N9CTZ6_9GLOM|nr:2642_t:CDS:1 [Funneliformis caledonium]
MEQHDVTRSGGVACLSLGKPVGTQSIWQSPVELVGIFWGGMVLCEGRGIGAFPSLWVPASAAVSSRAAGILYYLPIEDILFVFNKFINLYLFDYYNVSRA